jgi:uncharacterized protein (DUF1800 family)
MNLSRRKFIRVGSGVALVATAGCGKVPEIFNGLLPSSRPNLSGPFQPPGGEQIDLISHALNRLTFGPRPGDYERVHKLGKTETAAVQAFIEEQLHPGEIDDAYTESQVSRFESLSEPLGELFEYREKILLDEMTQATVMRATYSERQLYEVMVQFWTDHFNIEPSKGDARWLKTADDRDVIRPHALGKFPQMLRASALSPAMLWYLDGRVNRRANDAEKPNENYARELLELHTLGVHGGYTQRDVMEVARCLTGWTVRAVGKTWYGLGMVEFKSHLHDKGAKEVLGHSVPAIPAKMKGAVQEDMGRAELDQVLEIVALHPSTAKHIATKLCRRFIDDEPPASAVATVAETFRNSGGDIPATLRTLFATAEFQGTRGNKFKRPFNFIVSALRATNADTDAGKRIEEYLLRMGHTPFRYPTPDGYPEEANPWLGTLLWRWNFAVALSENRLKGTRVDLAKLTNSLGGERGLMAHLLGRTAAAAETEGYHESGAGLALLLASPAFQRC